MSHWMPHGGCVQWNAPLLTVSILANLLIALSYFAIPIAIMSALRPVAPRFRRLFACFISMCGMTHLMQIVTVWQPVYWVEAGLSASTAIVSTMTAINLYLYGAEMIRGASQKREGGDEPEV